MLAMKTTKKNGVLVVVLLIVATGNVCGMERAFELTKKRPQSTMLRRPLSNFVGNILLGIRKLNPAEPFPFSDLPKEIQNEILSLLTINVNAESLETAAQTINALAQVNKELNALINEPIFCLRLIKVLAKKFNCSDDVVCKKLSTQEAKRRLDLQVQFFILCQKDFDMVKDKLADLCQQGVDLEFTMYDMTPLMVASAMASLDTGSGYGSMLNYLLANGAYINCANRKGQTALMYAAGVEKILSSVEGIRELVSYVDLDVNQQDQEGNTALIYLLQTIGSEIGGELLEGCNILLNAGADPERANFSGLTPLAVARERHVQQVIDLIQQAIDKKHGK